MELYAAFIVGFGLLGFVDVIIADCSQTFNGLCLESREKLGAVCFPSCGQRL